VTFAVVLPLFAINRIINIKYHCISAVIDGKVYKWKSKPGDFKIHIPSVLRIAKFAESTGRMSRIENPDLSKLPPED
jgi:hypothetical protein